MPNVEALLIDIDGVLSVSWEPIPGSIEAMQAFRRADLPVCLITNTTTHSRLALASTLRDAGFDVGADDIVTAVTATADYLRRAHAGRQVFVLSDGDPRGDLEGVGLVDRPEDAEVVVLGGAADAFDYRTVNAVVPAADGRRRARRDAPQHVLANGRRARTGRRRLRGRTRGRRGRDRDRVRQALGGLLCGGARCGGCDGRSCRDGR